MRADPLRLDSLVASIADGWPQDWGALNSAAEDERTLQVLGNLRVVAAIADHYRGLAANRRADRRDRRRVAPPPRRPGPRSRRWGRFVLRGKLGEGGYGEVYQAHDTQLDREVALKLLKPAQSAGDAGRRLLAEARMLARIRHPNVAAVYGAGEHDGRAGMWMELVTGMNLEELLRSHGPMSASEAALVGMDVCRALGAVHAAGLVHRDVKTSNVMREVGGRIVLTDFGASGRPGLQQGRTFAGTPVYVAPEVLAGQEATVRSDLYSLGVLLFRMVTASYPRPVEEVEGAPEPPSAGSPSSLRDLRPELPDAFIAAVDDVLAANPADRPPSAGASRCTLGLVLGQPNSWRRVGRPLHVGLSSVPTASLASLAPIARQPTAMRARLRS